MFEAHNKRMAFALLQEPYVGGRSKMKDYRGARVFQSDQQGEGVVKAAVVVFDSNLDVTLCPNLTTNNFAVVKVKTSAWEITAVSFYFEPRPTLIEPHLQQLKNIVQSCGSAMVIIGGDANAKSVWWGSPIDNDRGDDMSGTLEELNLQVLNTGSIPTFDTIRGGVHYTSFVDLTACTPNLLDRIEDWRVDEGVTTSDHNTILFALHLKRVKGMAIQRTTRKFNTKKANWDTFRENLAKISTSNNINKEAIDKINNVNELENKIKTYIKMVTDSCKDSIPEIKTDGKISLPWWSDKLTKLKKEVARRKRRVRCAAPSRKQKVVDEYLEVKIAYESETKLAQIKSWKEFCEKQDRENLWQGIYRVIGRTKKRHEDIPLSRSGQQLGPRDSALLLAETFYPADDEAVDTPDHGRIRELAEQANGQSHDEQHDPPFTAAELRMAVDSFNPKKAPGADGLTADICKEAIVRAPESFLSLANKCLELGHFPTPWKEATVVILRKPGRENYTEPKSHRPIGLLPVMGKILEKMLIGRVKWHLVPKLSPSQYGFMPQRSTEDSLYDLTETIKSGIKHRKLVTVVSLDIEGAFDNAWWPAIRLRLAEEGCPVNVRRLVDSYLEDRKIRLRYAGEEVYRNTSKGCVQGSIGGPVFWNILLNPLLKALEAAGIHVQAFADDVMMLFEGKTALEIEKAANAALDTVHRWGISNKLRFAPQKTTAITFTNKLKYDNPRLNMNGVRIDMAKEIKILGLWIDQKLTFNKHTSYVCNKATDLYKQLSRAAKTSWGLHPEVVKTIYRAVTEPVISYAAAVWAPATQKIGIQRRLNAVQRGFAQKLCKAYKTVSLNSALVLAGILPLDLRVQEAAAMYLARRGVSKHIPGDREIERKTPFAELPHPAQHIAHQFIRLENADQLDRSEAHGVKIYTDGSKIDGNVGAALSLWSNAAETRNRRFKLPSFCSVYQAELLAICKAMDEVKTSKERSFGIYSDSRSALETVANPWSLHPLAVQTREKLQYSIAEKKMVQLYWIKAHAGLEGNERADELAKSAAQTLKTKPLYDKCPISFVKRQIRMCSLDKWNKRYKEGTTASVTKVFFPDAIQAHRTLRSIELNNIKTQIMTGHGGFSQYLHRFRVGENPSCICDDTTDETPLHIIIDCPVYGNKRLDIEHKIGVKITKENIPKIIIDNDIRDDFLEYCVEICSKVISKNKNVKVQNRPNTVN